MSLERKDQTAVGISATRIAAPPSVKQKPLMSDKQRQGAAGQQIWAPARSISRAAGVAENRSRTVNVATIAIAIAIVADCLDLGLGLAIAAARVTAGRGRGGPPRRAGHPKKLGQACEACRGLKVRCDPDPDDDEGPCRRCRKAGRNCVTTRPTRKRQKKTDSRVLELERKIDALTASLQARVAPPPGFVAPPAAGASAGVAAHGARAPGEALGAIWGHRAADEGAQTQSPAAGDQSRPHQRTPAPVAGQKRKSTHHGDGPDDNDGDHRRGPAMAWPVLVPSTTQGDIVERGLVSKATAAELFSRYKESMIRHLPAVVFPPGTTSAELRRTRPYLFLAVMAAAASERHELQRVLHKELMQLFAYKIVVAGEKNLELVQALQVAVIWYWPPENFEELKFYQLVHMAAVMALDIGLGKRAGPSCRGGSAAAAAGGAASSSSGQPPVGWRDGGPGQFKRQPQPDPTSIECRRAWLACHFFAANTAMSLHRPNLIRWSPFMSECLEVLASSPDAAPTDQYFCHLVWTHRMADEIGMQFSMDDPGVVVNVTDARTRYALRALERELEKYRESVPKEFMQPTLKTTFHLLDLYMHELVLRSDTSTDQIRPPFNTDAIKDGMVGSDCLSAAHINALSACLTAIDGILACFLAMDVGAIRCLPVFSFVRVAHAVVVLMKMYFSASDPRSELGRVIERDHMRVDFYLDALLDKFRATAADDRCRPAARFLLVLAMLKSWFLKHNPEEGTQGQAWASADAAGRPFSSARQASTLPGDPAAPQHPQQRSLNTPLQVLSEVAMGREPGGPPPPALSGISAHRRLPLFHDAASSTTDATPPSNANSYAAAAAHSFGDSGSHPGQPPSSSTAEPMGAAPPALAGPTGAPFPPAPWMDPQTSPDWTLAAGLPPGFDVESIGFVLDPHDPQAGGAKMVLNEPWFTDMFPGLPDPNMFPF
ncbi:hypothetical protein HIM_02488 [Hirsutella minnesotensis 3608]|nr:hypothetical protein HIM_02488 [Hirsutella minnesotensis 3608]